VGPGSQTIAFDNRAALVRAVREIVTTSTVEQLVDLGSGLPTADNVHRVAQRHQPAAKVVYVDNDPVVLAHGRALLEILPPGIVPAAEWHPEQPVDDLTDWQRLIAAGLAVKR
jgi:trans-aconitate methyltransferase